MSTVPASFIENQLAPMLFEAAMELIDDEKAKQMLLCYSWATFSLIDSEDVSEWLMTALGLLEDTKL